MLAREAQRVDHAGANPAALDAGVRGLLDHIATELAEEYIRLMEGAGIEADGDAIGGDDR